jgi:hypothetical protein
MSSFKKFREHLTLLKNIVSQRFLMRNLGLIKKEPNLSSFFILLK